MILTLEQVVEKNPCKFGLEDFKEFLDGKTEIELTAENIKLAENAGLEAEVEWAVEHELIPRELCLLDPYYAYSYALYVDKAPRDDTRDAALADPSSAYLYALYVDKGPRDDTRNATLANGYVAFLYDSLVGK